MKVISNLKFSGVVGVVVLATWLLHEFAHWFTASVVLGYKSALTLNRVYLVDGAYASHWHMILVSAVGPLVTILAACLAYIYLIKLPWKPWLYAVLMTALYPRALAGFFNFINLNDEGRIGVALGIGAFTLSLLVSALLAMFLIKVNRKHHVAQKLRWTTLAWVIFYSSILILADQFFNIVLWIA